MSIITGIDLPGSYTTFYRNGNNLVQCKSMEVEGVHDQSGPQCVSQEYISCSYAFL